jgi:hypothetical protein
MTAAEIELVWEWMDITEDSFSSWAEMADRLYKLSLEPCEPSITSEDYRMLQGVALRRAVECPPDGDFGLLKGCVFVASLIALIVGVAIMLYTLVSIGDI